MIKEAIETVVNGRSLTFEQAAAVMEEIMIGEATPSQVAAFATALRIKGETVDEIAGLASVMQAKATPIQVTPSVVDTCGTGGDGSSSFNISTAAAFIVAGAGLKVAKHGNRAMSSHCGSADVLEALGVKIELGAEAVARCLETVGIGFIFAPAFHPAMKYVTTPRREIGVRTVFNILGPLTNPAKAKFQVIGVPSKELGEKIAYVLHLLGTEHSLVVHGIDGMDEISISRKSLVWDVNHHTVLPPYEVSPDDFGFMKASMTQIKGGTARQNAKILRSILSGEVGARRNIVIMNAAAALVAGNQASDLKEGASIAEKALDSGQALAKLDELIEFSQSLNTK
ncbi:MAG: anthranilate phosphoribosyltransferase [Dehalococcoidia bacterium]|nr:anthranilate phosphoribosyltransferase [Dehalococcoidia bacterium]RLC65059.1 MAG: anthranilate phosphoribosyltransferase [Chloroflexota bacterium]